MQGKNASPPEGDLTKVPVENLVVNVLHEEISPDRVFHA